MLRIVLVLFLSFATSVFVGASSIIPQPQKIRITDGGIDPNEIDFITVEGTGMPVLYGFLDRLPRVASDGLGVQLIIDKSLPEVGEEGYMLSISPSGIFVKARTDAGLFYGAGTLAQLIQEALDNRTLIQSEDIVDFPALPVRAVHFDTKHHLDRAEYYYSLIDQLAYWKINTVIWEVEDKLKFDRRPECSSPNALSKQEMRAIASYAKDRHVLIEPLVQGLGHAGFILKNHWELRENPESDWEFCPSNPDTYLLQFDLYRDALEAFPYGRFLHVGGDEITAIGIDDRCIATGKSPLELQMEWLDKVCSFAKEQGRTPIFWDDMPFKYSGLWRVIFGNLSNEEVDARWDTEKLDASINLFPTDCIYMRWLYGDPNTYAHLKMLDWYKNKGLRVMAATAAADGGSPYMPRRSSKIHDIQSFCQLAVDNNLNEGIMATCWDDGSPHWETVRRGFAALGEYSWNPTGRDINEFKKGFEKNCFGLYNSETDFIEELENAAYFFDGALICSGRRNPAWQVRDFTLIDMPDSESPGKWTEKYRELLDSASVQAARCQAIDKKIDDALNRARRNRYTLEVYSATNQLFSFPARVLKAIEKYDNTSDFESREKAKEDVINVCKEFDDTKNKVITTYGKTRFMEQPRGYLADMNHHKHLAALSPDPNWLFLYENAFIKKLMDTLSK